MNFTSSQMVLRNKLLARIHTAPMKKQMGDDTYREMLQSHYKQRSAAELSIDQLLMLVDYLYEKSKNPSEAISATRKRWMKKTSWQSQMCRNETTRKGAITPAQIVRIERTWAAKARNPKMAALRQFISKNFGKTILRLEVLSRKEASGIINAINHMQERGQA